MKAIHTMVRALVLTLLFTTAFILGRPAFAGEQLEDLGKAFHASAETAVEEIERQAKADLKQAVAAPDLKLAMIIPDTKGLAKRGLLAADIERN